MKVLGRLACWLGFHVYPDGYCLDTEFRTLHGVVRRYHSPCARCDRRCHCGAVRQ